MFVLVMFHYLDIWRGKNGKVDQCKWTKEKKSENNKIQHSRLWHMQIWSTAQPIIIIVIGDKCGLQTLWQIVKKGWICKFLGFCTGVAVVSVLLGYDATPLGCQFPTCQDNIVVPSSGVKMSKKTEFCELAPCGVILEK